jgi:uncharacterized MAPEG superfamily protein
MLTWIFLALIVYYAGVFLPSLFLIPRIGLASYMASRDGDPAPNPVHSRAQRATRNMQENLAPFLALAILAYVVPDADMGLAIPGAQLFVLGRVAFLPLYLFAVPWARSIAFTAGTIGMIMMAVALI